jgi:signal peptidase II
VPTVTALPVPEAPVREGALAAVFFPVVLLVAALDLATKAWAVAALGAGEHTALLPGLSLALVFNTASAGGVWLGEHTRAINFAATGIVIGMLTILVPHLARVERRSTIALALTAGGGLGNLTSLASSGRGVPDFLALHHRGGAWVVNVADLAIFVGLALMVGTIARLTVRVLRGERQLR